jgi:hypothetical protein
MLPEMLAMLPHGRGDREIEKLRACWRGDETALFDAVVSVLARNIDSFGTDVVYRWIAELVRLCPISDARAYFDFLRDRLRTRVPSPRPALATVDRDAYEVLRAVIDCLGHARVEDRFRALYAVVETVLHADPATVQVVVAELEDSTHPRWMTKREWLLFALHHVALVRPALLAAHAPTFVAHATSSEFPHAKCRYHAREIVLHVVSEVPDAIDADLRTAVEGAQQPLVIIERAWEPSDETAPWTDVYRRPFHFSDIDTLPYWYDPLGDCFNVSRWAVAERAERWIVQQWGITEATCDADADADRHNYDWRSTSNDHGSEPRIETLHSYAERHGMFLAAGEMIDTLPVAKEDHNPLDEWTDWLRYHGREADPSLPSRLLREPPLDPENYGVFAAGFAAWSAARPAAAYERHLRDGDLFVLDAHIEATFGEHDFRVSVQTAFVPRTTAGALVRAITDAAEPPSLPVGQLSHDTILPEIEEDRRRNAAAYPDAEDDDDEIQREPPLFALRPTTIRMHQEFPFHGEDARWQSFARNYSLPTRAVEEALHAVRIDPLSLAWRGADGTVVLRTELWQDGKQGDEADGAEGSRLLIRRDALAALLAATGDDIIFAITSRRQKTYRYRDRAGNDEYDRGSTRAYLASSLLTL